MSVNHLLYSGDNLQILPILSEYYSKVDLIYIDPPYNTGKVMGKYNDSFNSHKDWLSFMEPRLIEGRKFLSERGLFFISIGEQEEAYLKLLCNDIFGEKNKLSPIVWECKYTNANECKTISNRIEYILVYARDIKNVILNTDPLRKEYVDSTYKNPDNDPRGDWRTVQIYKKKNPRSYKVTSPTGKEWIRPWNYSENQWHDYLVKNDLLYWGKDGSACPTKKVFLKDNKGLGINNLWLGSDVGYTSDGGKVLENIFGAPNKFLFPKPVSLMKRIIQIATTPNSIVMDYFAGSCSFAHAVLEYNRQDGGARQSISITNNENNICDEVAYPRLRKVIEGYTGQKDGKEYPPINASLKYFRL